jgi:HSP20 family protein
MRTQRKFTGVMPRNTQSRSLDSFFLPRYRELLGINDIAGDFVLPLTNEKASDGSFKIELALPGIDKEDIQIFVEQGNINVVVEDQQELRSSADDYRRKEFNYSSFNNKYIIPEEAVEEEISAEYKNGVIYINIPCEDQDKEAAFRRKIEVK